MTKQNKKLLIMFILSLPALPVACLCWLMDRYINCYDLPPEKRMMGTKEHFIAMMCALMFTGLLFGIPIYLLNRCTP